jgi:hypothetical protein
MKIMIVALVAGWASSARADCASMHCPCSADGALAASRAEVVATSPQVRVRVLESLGVSRIAPGEVLGGPAAPLPGCVDPPLSAASVGQVVLAIHPNVGDVPCEALAVCRRDCELAYDESSPAVAASFDECAAACADDGSGSCRRRCREAVRDEYAGECGDACAASTADACDEARHRFLATVGVWVTPWADRMPLGEANGGGRIFVTPESAALIGRPDCEARWPEPQDTVPCDGPQGCDADNGWVLPLALLARRRRQRPAQASGSNQQASSVAQG